MKIKKHKKIKEAGKGTMALLLAICLLAGIFSSVWKNVLTIQAATDDYMIYFGVGGINNPKSEDLSTSEGWFGDYVWFGSYEGNAVKWRVLDKSGSKETGTSSMDGGMLLQSDTILVNREFGDGVVWAESGLRTWLQGNNEFLSGFTNAEISAIMESTKDKGSDTSSSTSVELLNDTIFILDYTDVNNSKYGYMIGGAYDTSNSNISDQPWWLRSTFLSMLMNTINHNELTQQGAQQEAGVVPALNIKLDTILFSSVPGTDFSSLLSTKGNNNSREWKLTLLDNNQSVSVDTSDGKEMTRSDKGGKTTITVPYTYSEGTNAKFANQLSVMITDKDYTPDNTAVIKAYGKVSGDDGLQENGEISFVLPEDYDANADKVYLLSEQVNGDNMTNYASFPTLMNIPTSYTIKYDSNGGSGQMQSEKAGVGEAFTLPDCGFTPPEGKKFKEWAIGSTDGTTVSAGGNYTFMENTIVYAVWENITYTIEYNANGGSGEMQSGTAVAGTEFTLPDCGFTPVEGKEFKEWAIGSTEGTVLSAGESYTFTENTTVYAIWKAIEEETTEEEDTTEEETTTEEEITTEEDITTQEETTTEEEITTEEETTTEEEITTEEDITTQEETTTEEEITTEEDTTTEEKITTGEGATTEEEITTEEDTTTGEGVTTEKSTSETDTAAEENTVETDTTTASDQGAAVNTGDVIPMALLGILLASAVVVMVLSKIKVNE